jgi:hypothetical protein
MVPTLTAAFHAPPSSALDNCRFSSKAQAVSTGDRTSDYPYEPVLEQVRNGLAVRRHGAFTAVETGGEIWTLQAYPTLTRRGSKITFAGLEQRLVSDDAWPELAGYGWGDVLIAARVESGRIVREIRVPLGGDDDPHTGVREPRRPHPQGGTAEAREPVPDDEAQPS